MTNKIMINRFKDMADCADASYALLDEVYKIDEWNKIFGDNLTKGHIVCDDIEIINSKKELLTIIKKDSNTTYARAIEARFCNEMIIKDDDGKDKQIKSIKDISLQATLSHRTKNFVNRYELIHHIPNTLSGFSATIFRDLGELDTATNARKLENDFSYIIAFRGTEADSKGVLTDVLGADVLLATTGVAITQAKALELLSKSIFRTIIAHHKLSIENANSYVYNHNLESLQDNYQSYQSINKYFSSNNIRVTTTGHSLGGHLAQVFVMGYPVVVKELYTYNAPGLGGIITSAMVIFLRVLRVIWKLLVKLVRSVAKLFNPNGFTRKVLDKSLQASGYEGGTDNAIRLMETHKDTEIFETLGDSAKKAQKGNNLGVAIHHLDSIRAAMKNDDSLSYAWQQFYEPTTSVISDLGIKLGLTLGDRLDYKNTEALHLINVGKHSHYLKEFVESLYLYAYILSYEPNENRCKDFNIAQTLDSLNDFIQCLLFQSKFYKLHFSKLEKTAWGNDKKKKFNAEIGPLDCVLYPICLHTNAFVSHLDTQSFKKDNFIDCLLAYQIQDTYLQILDTNDIDTFTLESSIAKIYALYQCQFFIMVHKNGDECIKEKDILIKTLGYKSSFVTMFCLSNEHLTQDYIDTRKELYKIAHNLRYYYWHYPYELDSNGNMIENDKLEYLIFSRADLLRNLDEAIIVKKPKYNRNDTQDIMKNVKIELDEVYVKSNKITIFAKDNSIIDSKSLEKDLGLDFTLPCDVYFYSLLLRGGKEDIDNPRFFYGEKGEVYMSDESDNIEIFYNNARVSMTNYYYHAYS
ncbi:MULTISPECIES: hypothetical protein [Helicobacter]|uniref:Fungal lipase-like domain-containing protein n=3 Tax=Helicobacter TaxID=209 RepID=T1DVJ6_9HELI|nr:MULTISPECIES: hypothetical protein [Helicobacter]BAM32800.1 hypothetical protein HCBAA847_1570 [Helicobacter cinaedi CCUG 18818 = ATCC BAA-847]GAD18607.1 hypothetical protein HFN_2019 [Helicobacter fennelliae MRY12-0050]STP14505.1 putative lipase [Helicobacter fennelliae]